MSYKILFSPAKIGKMRLKNRLVMPPMVRNYADTKGMVTQKYVDHIERIAKGGVGMMVLEASYISNDGKGFATQLGIHSDACITGLKKLAKAAHKYGAKIGPQIYHAGRQTSSKVTGVQPVSASAIPCPVMQEMPRALSEKEIKKVVLNYAKAVLRAKKAGFDFVELHGAHGYLIQQFLSPFSNKRTDGYGGTPEKRMRFLREIIEEARRLVGRDFPITVRLSGEELVPGGLTIKDTIFICKNLEEWGVDALHISVGNYASMGTGLLLPPMAIPDAPLVKYAEAVKKAVKIPVITVGKIRYPQMAEKILREGKADFVAIGRQLLADPDWPNKAKNGQEDEINHCVACNQGCLSRLFAGLDVWCTVNPACAREAMFAKKRVKKQKVLIAGGGPAGMSAACYAASLGHEVILYEKTRRLGGQLPLAAAAPYRGDWNLLLEKLICDLDCWGVKVKLGKELTPRLAAQEKADAVIVAIGSSAKIGNIPGVGRDNVVLARDVLAKRVRVSGKVVLVGGGCAGAQTAEYLADRGHDVTVVEAGPAVAADAPSTDQSLMFERFAKKKIKMLTNTKVEAIGAEAVTVSGPKGMAQLPADTVVLCLGSYPNNGLQHELKKVVKKVIVVGDAKEPRRLTEAVAEGALAALSI